MAVSIARHCLVAPGVLPASFISKPTESRPSVNLLPRRGNHRLGLSASLFRPVKISGIAVSGRRMWPPVAVAKVNAGPPVDGDSCPDMLAEENDVGDSVSVGVIIEAYKQAIYSCDKEMLFDIEDRLCNVVVKKQELDSQFSSMTTEINSGKDKLLRLQADFDNFRKRFEKEMLRIRGDSQKEVLEKLLPMVDSFDTARKHVKPETDKEKKIDISYQGIYRQFVEVLRSLQVSAIATVGKPLDPLLHEAVAREKSEEYKAGIIIQELRRGFSLNGQVLRAAKVKVSLGPGGKKVDASTETPSMPASTTMGNVDK